MKIKISKWFVLLFFPLAFAHASEDSVLPPRPFVPLDASEFESASAEGLNKTERSGPAHAFAPAASLAPAEIFSRTQAVLDHFGVPRAPESSPFFARMQGGQTAEGYAAVARIMDPKGFFAGFTLDASGGLSVFQDPQSRGVLDFDYRFGTAGALAASPSHDRLVQAARNNSKERPLTGLKVALDPGHMGGDDWDRHTGKFVHDHRGRKLSEGTMALQISLLLERDLTALGAEVMITHREQGPVTDVAYQGMDLKPYALDELAETTQAPWFQRQIQAAPAGPGLFAAFAANPSFRALFDTGFYNHDTYFLLREDLEARSRKIEAFDADISLVIHFDTSSPPGDSQGVGAVNYDATKVYVVGSYSPIELSSREARRYFAQHALDAPSWQDSLELGRSVVGRLHRDLALPFDRGGGGTSAQVEPGIFSRNLGVSRRVTGRALTYVECLFYNDPREFAALSDFKYTLEIGGKPTRYSERLVQVKKALLDGVLDFVGSRAH